MFSLYLQKLARETKVAEEAEVAAERKEDKEEIESALASDLMTEVSRHSEPSNR